MLDVLVELLERDDLVAVGVGCAAEAVEHVVGEEPVSQLRQLERQLGRAGGGDDGPALRASEALGGAAPLTAPKPDA
jgi:hypothetical protein